MNYLNNPHYDLDKAQLDHFDQSTAKRQRYQLWKERLNQVELQIEKDEAAPDPDADLSPKKKRLKRQIKEEALLRLEEAARTEDNFAAVQYHWDRRDSNREARSDTIFVANRKTQRHCCDKCRRKGESSPIKQKRGFAPKCVRNLLLLSQTVSFVDMANINWLPLLPGRGRTLQRIAASAHPSA